MMDLLLLLILGWGLFLLKVTSTSTKGGKRFTLNKQIKMKTAQLNKINNEFISLDKETTLEIEYKGFNCDLSNINGRKNRKVRKDKIRDMLIWKIQKIYHIDSYDKIVPTLLYLQRSGKYDSLVDLLDTLDKLHVDTTEIIDENPSILDFFAQLGNLQAEIQMV